LKANHNFFCKDTTYRALY